MRNTKSTAVGAREMARARARAICADMRRYAPTRAKALARALARPKHVRRRSAKIGDVHDTVTQSVDQGRAGVISIRYQKRIYAYSEVDICLY